MWAHRSEAFQAVEDSGYSQRDHSNQDNELGVDLSLLTVSSHAERT